jgi:hypothetical protein
MMSRPSLTLRKPSVPSEAAVAAFVAGRDASSVTAAPILSVVASEPELEHIEPAQIIATEAAAIASAKSATRKPKPSSMNNSAMETVPTFQRASRAVVQRRNGAARRRTTVYLDLDVASHLSAALASNDQELSDAVNTALRMWLRK